MADANGPYSAKEVARLDEKQIRMLRKQAQDFAIKSKELWEIIFAQDDLREAILKNEKVRRALRNTLGPTYSRLAAKGPSTAKRPGGVPGNS